MDDEVIAVEEGIPRLEALRWRDLLTEAGVPASLDPEGGFDLGRATSVLVASARADFARRLIAEAREGAEWVADDSPLGLVERIREHVGALEALLRDLEAQLSAPAEPSAPEGGTDT